MKQIASSAYRSFRRSLCRYSRRFGCHRANRRPDSSASAIYESTSARLRRLSPKDPANSCSQNTARLPAWFRTAPISAKGCGRRPSPLPAEGTAIPVAPRWSTDNGRKSYCFSKNSPPRNRRDPDDDVGRDRARPRTLGLPSSDGLDVRTLVPMLERKCNGDCSQRRGPGWERPESAREAPARAPR
jgi:hypothetical protein